ncbi:GlsB/YeaQ/YmgE family stress response membrane protein [Burkholderia ambifaria]|uniref:GlsB/YeaQ/YmgE family stress response membrane protein n=1 Tax=Burkholderia ambifaria TaxID=152480 RepID=UPI001BA280DB|nr:GlsB/YeaQ/YmgE family stress response membrane protein [Burkholderia ambifaria]MBR8334163.1 GlsB/YeaQ/YmgE family stress response membrane protein [Burkholderia ambifaria]
MLHQIVVWLIVGVVAGWISGVIVKGAGFGIVVDIVVGIAGAFVGGWLATVFGISVGGGLLSSIVVAVAGAVLLLLVIRLVRSA